jgi:hypothetical protein
LIVRIERCQLEVRSLLDRQVGDFDPAEHFGDLPHPLTADLGPEIDRNQMLLGGTVQLTHVRVP